MIRHCDGNDPNLVRFVEVDAPPQSALSRLGDPRSLSADFGKPKKTEQPFPCDCGLVFNDENRSVIHPHKVL